MATKREADAPVARDPNEMVRVRCLDADVRLIANAGVRIEREQRPDGQALSREFAQGEVFRIQRQHAAHLGDRFEVLEQ